MTKGRILIQYAALCVMALVITGCGVPKSEHKLLEEKYAKIQNDMVAFNDQVKALQIDNASQEKEIENLNGTVTKLTADNDALKTEHAKLTEENQKLKVELAKLKVVEK